ncbi:Uncharacterised protein [uncultured archaeon]|nr:Uncharacterised protein [uncultured archaeon]
MSKSLSEVSYSIRNQLKGWIASQNEVISIEFIYKKISDVRSLLLQQWYTDNKWIDQESYSQVCLEIKCEPIQCYDKHSKAYVDSGMKRYVVNAPFIEQFCGEQAIKYFGAPDLKHPYAKRSVSGQSFSESDAYTHHEPSFTRIGNRFILEHLPETGVKFVTLVALFEDVVEVCEPDEVFPFPSHLLHKLELLVIQQIQAPAKQMKPSSVSDSTDRSPVTEQTIKQTRE